jgi:C1A family cysteine protease
MTDEVVDLSAALGPVRDQGNRGTCLAFATTTGHESTRLSDLGGPRADLSEELLYWACKQLDGNSSSGTTAGAAARALAEMGQPVASLWPYDALRDDASPLYRPPAAALEPLALHRATLSRLPIQLDMLQDSVRVGHVVVLAIELWDAFYAADGAVIAAPDRGDLIGDGHAVAMVGFDTRNRTIRLRNSWGEHDWGDGGYAALAAAALPIVCFGAWGVIEPF